MNNSVALTFYSDEKRPLMHVSPSESGKKAKVSVAYPNDGEPEYQILINDGEYWYEHIFFTESQIPSVVASGLVDQYPKFKNRLVAIDKLEKEQ